MPVIENEKRQAFHILIFGGTIEGRQVSDYLCEKQVAHTVCVATEYGEEVLKPQAELTVHQGRMDVEQMREFLRLGQYALVIDATHPYAVEVSKNIREAAQKENVRCLRYLRAQSQRQDENNHLPENSGYLADAACSGTGPVSSSYPGSIPGAVYVNTTQEAADYLEASQGGIFLTTGSKELHIFTETISEKSRIFARVLPSAEVLASCRALGLEGKQLCAMQGPFSAEINRAMLRAAGSAFLVTKETGASGGFPEKMEAARACQVTPVIIRRPKETGADWAEIKARLDELIAEQSSAEQQHLSEAHQQCQISCIGIGMGTPDTLTCAAAQEIRSAQVLFGAKRILECVRMLLQGEYKTCANPAYLAKMEKRDRNGKEPLLVPEYNAGKIAAWLEAHPQYRRVAILMSGDVGFYSGARQVAEIFPAEQVRYYCGISSVVYFASKIPTSWQDAKLLSAHGKKLAIQNYVMKYPKIILLVGDPEDVERICRELVTDCRKEVRVTVGSSLSYPEETIKTGTPSDFLTCKTTGPHIMMLENPGAGQVITPGIPDGEFVRWDDVPMTKEEIRALSVAKLRLYKDSVVYDVGAGTGSVSVECARLCTAGWVYAIERKENTIDLIRQNGAKFGLSNLTAIAGTAPEAMQDLPAPTHAFIGGSSGNMREIVEELLKKNPCVRIVINTIALESIAEVTSLLCGLKIEDADIVQVSAAKTRKLGRYHMMSALNPIYIVSFGGRKV